VNPTGSLRADAPPPAGGWFKTLPPGTKLPSESSCDARVHWSNWEPRPENDAENRATPIRPLIVRRHPDFNTAWQQRFRPRISGNFTGTTDEIIQWAACKWGLADDMLRAEAVQETHWLMRDEGDFEPRSNGHCARGDHRNPCPTSFGILQIKWYYNPDKNPNNNSYPMSKNMTAFSIDYTAAQLRGCYEGWEYFGGKSRGDLWGCMGGWFSGGWHDSGANEYIGRVRNYYKSKPWRHW
jgi:autotransporter family porin